MDIRKEIRRILISEKISNFHDQEPFETIDIELPELGWSIEHSRYAEDVGEDKMYTYWVWNIKNELDEHIGSLYENGTFMYEDEKDKKFGNWIESKHNFKNNYKQAARWLWLKRQKPIENTPTEEPQPTFENIQETKTKLKSITLPGDNNWRATPMYVTGALTGEKYLRWEIFDEYERVATLLSDGSLGFFDNNNHWKASARKFENNPLGALRYIFLINQKPKQENIQKPNQ